jgi:hypothetical protein
MEQETVANIQTVDTVLSSHTWIYACYTIHGDVCVCFYNENKKWRKKKSYTHKDCAPWFYINVYVSRSQINKLFKRECLYKYKPSSPHHLYNVTYCQQERDIPCYIYI